MNRTLQFVLTLTAAAVLHTQAAFAETKPASNATLQTLAGSLHRVAQIRCETLPVLDTADYNYTFNCVRNVQGEERELKITFNHALYHGYASTAIPLDDLRNPSDDQVNAYVEDVSGALSQFFSGFRRDKKAVPGHPLSRSTPADGTARYFQSFDIQDPTAVGTFDIYFKNGVMWITLRVVG